MDTREDEQLPEAGDKRIQRPQPTELEIQAAKAGVKEEIAQLKQQRLKQEAEIENLERSLAQESRISPIATILTAQRKAMECKTALNNLIQRKTTYERERLDQEFQRRGWITQGPEMEPPTLTVSGAVALLYSQSYVIPLHT